MADVDDSPVEFAYHPTTPPRSFLASFTLYALAILGLLSLAIHVLAASGPARPPKRRRKKRKPKVAARQKGVDQNGDESFAVTNTAVEESDSESDVDERALAPRDYSKLAKEKITNAMVNGAVLLKRSPIPDWLSSITNASVEGYSRVNNAFALEDKMIKAGQKAVSAGVTAGGIFAHAAIKSAIAYQRTPGRNESPKTKGQLAIADEVEVDEEPEEPRSVRIIRVIDNSVPGSIPPPELVEVGTQTDPIQILSSSGVSSLAGSEFSISRSATPSLESLPESSTVTGIFASYLSSTLQLTSNIAATTSEYVLGKDRTLALRGIDPIEAYKPTEPVDGTVTYLNVGGSLFATTLETLQAAPTTSLLYEFFIDPEKRETLTLRSGAFFVDRDGTHFSHILNYLRGIPTHATITNTQHLRSLLVEAQYYRLDELAVEIDEQVRELELREADLGQLLNKVGQRIAKDKWRWVTAANAVVIIAVTVGLILY